MYTARISSAHPMLIVMLIDQSGSMSEKTRFQGELRTKAEAVSLSVNMLLSELMYRCFREDSYRDYFELAILGYRDNEVVPLLGTPKAPFVRSSALPALERRKIKLQRERTLPDGHTQVSVVEQRIWIESYASGNTPMHEALSRTLELLRHWTQQKAHRSSYPPLIFNITDGESSDGSERALIDVATKIKALSTEDGSSLLVNVHITSDQSATPVIFASSQEELSQCRYARMLYEMASPMPELYREGIVALKGAEAEQFRGVSYNAAITDLVSMLNIGSVSVSVFE